MWTPEREDLLLELCGDIGDEDTSLVERAEARADRFENYSSRREAEAHGARAAVQAISNGIPLGQPILVGHHSERRARRDAERIEAGMQKAVRLWDTAKYWQDRAAGAVRAATYKERPDVRARRIKTLEAARRKQERYAAQYAQSARFWRGEMKLRHRETGEVKPFEVTLENAIRFTGSAPSMHRSYPLAKFPRELPASQYEGDMSLYSALSEGVCTVDQARTFALSVCDQVARHTARWMAHYDNRLAYERTMLAAAGGTVADRTGPEAGGACRCWASPGYGKGFSLIQKVNKVSVTVLDEASYARGPGLAKRLFRRNVPFDKLTDIMTKAQVDQARTEGRLAMVQRQRFGVVSADMADIWQADFLALNGQLGKFDRIVMNPPFENGSDIKHIRHALTFLKPGGRLVALCAAGSRQEEAFQDGASVFMRLPPGAFADQGTNVNVAIVVIDADKCLQRAKLAKGAAC